MKLVILSKIHRYLRMYALLKRNWAYVSRSQYLSLENEAPVALLIKSLQHYYELPKNSYGNDLNYLIISSVCNFRVKRKLKPIRSFKLSCRIDIHMYVQQKLWIHGNIFPFDSLFLCNVLAKKIIACYKTYFLKKKKIAKNTPKYYLQN